MAERRKRQRLSEDGTAVTTLGAENPSVANELSSKATKETNASAKRSLFVRSLPTTVTSDTLTELFSEKYPLKHATVVLDPSTKQSKGYGFVTFADAEDAKQAQEEFNGLTLQGRKIRVEIAEPRQRDDARKPGSGTKVDAALSDFAKAKKERQEKLAAARVPPKLIVRNLPWSIKDQEQLAVLFRPYGKVKFASLANRGHTQLGYGFVGMRGRKNAEKAMEKLNGMLVEDRPIAVDWAVEKDVYEQQKLVGGADEDVDKEDNTEKLEKQPPKTFDGDDDVANFFKNHAEALESEEEDSDRDSDGDDVVAGQIDEGDDDGWEELSEDDNNSDNDVEDNSENDAHDGGVSLKPSKVMIDDNSTTLFVRNLPFTTLDPDLKEHFSQFGPVRYARVVMDRATDRPKGTGFVCFFNVEDAEKCFRGAPKFQPTGANAIKKNDQGAQSNKRSVLQDENADAAGMYTIDSRLLQVSKAVEKEQATKLTEAGNNFRDNRDKDKRKLYLLSEGTVAANTPLYNMLAPSEIKMREESAMQRKKLVQNNPTLHLSLTRLSIRNLPKNVSSKTLKALAREAVVGFASDVKNGKRSQLSKEEEARGGDEMRDAEKQRKAKGKGIVKQSKIVFESREGAKVSEESGAGRSRGYGFVEYSSHRWALMGLRWLNGHSVSNGAGKTQRLIVEFAIENAQVVLRRREMEAKARTRSQQVMEARARGEMPEKEKQPVPRGTQMKKTRIGMKPGDKGKFGNHTEMAKKRKGMKSKEIGKAMGSEKDSNRGIKRKRDGEKGVNGEAGGSAKITVEDEKLARRQQIVNKKRAMRSARKKAGRA